MYHVAESITPSTDTEAEKEYHNSVVTVDEQRNGPPDAVCCDTEEGESSPVDGGDAFSPGLADEAINRVKELIARTAKLEFKIVANDSAVMFAPSWEELASLCESIETWIELDGWRAGARRLDMRARAVAKAGARTIIITVPVLDGRKFCADVADAELRAAIACELHAEDAVPVYVPTIADRMAVEPAGQGAGSVRRRK